MKSRVKAYTQKDIDQILEEVLPEIDRCVNANRIIDVIALIRHTGWGPKRIKDFLKTLDETIDDYAQNSKDGVFGYMADKELGPVGLTRDQITPKTVSAKELLRESKKRPQVDTATAKKLRANAIAAQKYIQKKKDG